MDALGQAATTFLRVVLPRRIDLHSSLAPLGRWGDDLLDRWDGRTLIRTIRVGSEFHLVPYAADLAESSADTLNIRVPTLAAVEADAVAAAISSTFVTGDDGLAGLCSIDEHVARLCGLYPGHVPVLVPDPFAALIRSISAQQVNLRWATVVRARLATRYGEPLKVGVDFVHVLDPFALAAASIEDLRALQLTNAKARAVVATAQAATAGELDRADLERLDDESLIAHLTRLPGIGRWSAEWFLARTLGRPRVVAGDLGVRKAVGRLYAAGMPSESEVRRLTEHWGPAAAAAQALALHDLAVSPRNAPAR